MSVYNSRSVAIMVITSMLAFGLDVEVVEKTINITTREMSRIPVHT